MNFLYVFLGGGIGSILRYGMTHVTGHCPTLIANIAGCFLIGAFYSLSAKLGWSDEMRLLLTTGLCGGFTTFSTFSNDSLGMLKSGELLTSAAYITATVLLGLLATYLGYLATKFIN